MNIKFLCYYFLTFFSWEFAFAREWKTKLEKLEAEQEHFESQESWDDFKVFFFVIFFLKFFCVKFFIHSTRTINHFQ